MKQEKEMIWIVTLLESDYQKTFFKTKAGTKKDFERILNAPLNSQEFHQWFQELIEEGCIENIRENNKKTTYPTYICNTKKLQQRLNQIPQYQKIEAYINRGRTLTKDIRL